MINFDDIDEWHMSLSAALQSCLPPDFETTLVSAKPKYVEDACDLLFSIAGKDRVIDLALAWLEGSSVAAYHGSRLTENEVENVKKDGLRPLSSYERRPRLVRALSGHPEWSRVQSGLSDVLNLYGSESRTGTREGQVHLTLSRAGLVRGFSHYLTHGSEFDQNVARALLGESGVEMLALDGDPCLVTVAIPGKQALEAAHPHFSVGDTRKRGEVPNMVSAFLKSWSYRIANPKFQSRTLKIDSGFVFKTTVQPGMICEIRRLDNFDR